MSRKNIYITCKGISDIAPRGDYTMNVDIDECDMSFLEDIDADVIVYNFGDVVALLDSIGIEHILDYIKEHEIIQEK